MTDQHYHRDLCSRISNLHESVLQLRRDLFAALEAMTEVHVTVRVGDEEADEDDEIAELREKLADAYVKLSGRTAHHSDCATSAAPAETPGPCDCPAPVGFPGGAVGGGILGGTPCGGTTDTQPVPATAAVVARRVDDLEQRLRTMQARVEGLQREMRLIMTPGRATQLPNTGMWPWPF